MAYFYATNELYQSIISGVLMFWLCRFLHFPKLFLMWELILYLQDMFAAGTDTIFTALEWAVIELIRNPSTIKTLQNEVREVVRSKEEINEQDLEKMLYLKAVLKESLRLHTPVHC